MMMEFSPQNSKNFYFEGLEEAILKMPNMFTFIVNIVDSYHSEKYDVNAQLFYCDQCEFQLYGKY